MATIIRLDNFTDRALVLWYKDGEVEHKYLQFTNGDRYVGEWENFIPNGSGMLQKADGTELQGTFTNGEFVG